MEIYLVGGAVRDQLLGLPVTEKDYVIVGSEPAVLLAQGYKQVGKDFPVFLHPQTKEEYALARTECKVGQGYKGFRFDFNPTISLQQDLARRDLTINAIAMTDSGKMIDPYAGQDDLTKRILRHVSPAFVEDPLRVLRVARFYARFKSLGFSIATETLDLMKTIVKSGEMQALTFERVWQEMLKALATSSPLAFFEVLHDVAALTVVFPEFTELLANKQQLTQVSAWLKQALDNDLSLNIRYALLSEHLTLAQLNTLNSRFPIPKLYHELAGLLVKHRSALSMVKQLAAEPLYDLLIKCDGLRRRERFKLLTQTVDILFANDPAGDYLLQACQVMQAIDIQSLLAQNLQGELLAKAIKEKRISCLICFMDDYEK